ncbi:MAG: helix-turn-helix domain-containing protein [Hyphomicrobium sp.]|nr:helix-turn-helix domain-containing protein [Hyphomicrobium sp.]
MGNTSMCQSPFLNLSEAAAFLRLYPRTLDNMRQRGTGPLYSKHGSRIVYHRDDLVAWSNERRRRTTTEKEPRPMAAPQVLPDTKATSDEAPTDDEVPDN